MKKPTRKRLAGSLSISPSFIRAARPEISEPLYQAFCEALEQQLAKPVGRGRFGADMQVTLINHGPVTIVVDTKNRE